MNYAAAMNAVRGDFSAAWTETPVSWPGVLFDPAGVDAKLPDGFLPNGPYVEFVVYWTLRAPEGLGKSNKRWTGVLQYGCLTPLGATVGDDAANQMAVAIVSMYDERIVTIGDTTIVFWHENAEPTIDPVGEDKEGKWYRVNAMIPVCWYEATG